MDNEQKKYLRNLFNKNLELQKIAERKFNEFLIIGKSFFGDENKIDKLSFIAGFMSGYNSKGLEEIKELKK